MAEQLSDTHAGKELEPLLEVCLQNFFGPDSEVEKFDRDGFDFKVHYSEIPLCSGIQANKICAVQVKSHQGESDKTPLKDMERACNSSGPEIDSGLILTTGRPNDAFNKSLEELRKRIKKPIGIIAGKDLTMFVFKYYPNLPSFGEE